MMSDEKLQYDEELNALAFTVNSSIKVIIDLLITHRGMTKDAAASEASRLVSAVNDSDIKFGREIGQFVRTCSSEVYERTLRRMRS